MLAIWLGTFFSWASYMLPLRWSAQEWQRNLPTSQNSPVLLAPPLFLSGFPAYTACLTNQCFIKI